MKKEGMFDAEATEANIALNERMDENGQILHGNREKETSSTTEANLEIQESFYGEKNQNEFIPTYINNNTAAIKITGNNK